MHFSSIAYTLCNVVQFPVTCFDNLDRDEKQIEALTQILFVVIIQIERNQHMRERPIGVTILAILAGIAAVLAAIHCLQFLGIIGFVVGPTGYKVHYFSFWYALMWVIMLWIYIWLVQALWRVEPQAWMFLVIVTIFELFLGFLSMFGANTWEDVSVSIILSAIILLYCMLPGVRRAFGTA